MKVKSLSCVRLLATPWTVAYRAPPPMGFSRQECWSGLPFPSPGDLPDPGVEPGSPALQADALPSEPPGKPIIKVECCVCIPDLSGCISATLDDMKGQVEVMSDDNLPFWTSVLSLVKGDWWKTIFTIVLVALMVLLCGPFILQCIMKFVT